ncbi:MAG TPA: TonB family protein [Rhizomicrobium sp.]
MEAVRHEILSSRPSGMTPRRAMIIGGVALLHVAAVWGLMNGMVAKVIQIVRPPIVVTVETQKPPPKQVLLPPAPPMQEPTLPVEPTVPIPDIVIANTEPSPIAVTPPPVNPPTPVADSSASGISNTHTVPPYPVEARVQAHQGTVTLQMIVTLQGDVASAVVVASSGYAELDQAAIAWVVSHWKYKPAIQGGIAVPSQTRAAVKFDLKTARR